MNRTLKALPFTQVTIEDQFWAPRLRANRENTLTACLDQCDSTGRISNFAKAGGQADGEFEGIYYNDSDVYKVLEGVAYALMSQSNAELERRADDIIDQIAAAQEEDGYLLCYFTLQAPDKKWTDMAYHEMYCGGHLMEAAVAYKKATGKGALLAVACKLADHYDEIFGPGKRHWVPGHEEIELALIKLYEETKEDRYRDLAFWLLEERGHGNGSGEIWDREGWGPAYCQDDKPIREMTNVSGHAVRAMYLYTAVADAAAITSDQGYIDALDRLWESVVLRNMYVTGGIGPSKDNEGFTLDYDLPNETAYCETCASVGMVYWNHRMNLLHRDAKYADVVETALYNGALAGVSLSGDRFFYVNPLASKGAHHRVEWFGTSCCPTQIARFVPSIGNYVYATGDQTIYINLYVAGTGTMKLEDGVVTLTQKTNYPWDGNVQITVDATEMCSFELGLRIPGWCESAAFHVNDVPTRPAKLNKGYATLVREWKTGDTVTLQLDMSVQREHALPLVKANQGRVALRRGPLVYCVEQADNELNMEQWIVSSSTAFFTEHRADVLEGVTLIHCEDAASGKQFAAIPYYAWDNREPGPMAVWLREEK